MQKGKGLARAERTDAQTMVVQTREIAKLISNGKWLPGITEQDFAEKYGLSIGSVRDRAAEARRLVQESFGNLDDLRADVLSQLSGIAREVRKKEPRTAVAALQTIAAVTGLIVTHRVNHEARRNLSPEQRREEIQRIRAQLDEAEKEIDLPLLPEVIEEPHP